MTRMPLIVTLALASATLYGGQAQPPGTVAREQQPATTAPARPRVSPATPAKVVPVRAVSHSTQAMTVATQRQLLDQYCVTCHNTRAKTAGVMLDAVDLANVGAHAEV